MKTSLSSVMADILADGLEQSALPSVDYGSIREKMHAQLERRSRTAAYAYNRCGLRPITLPPIGFQNAVQVCTCDYNGNCSWAWQCGGY
jgi:hypothetical protein